MGHELVTMWWGSGTSAEDLKNNIVRNSKSVAFKIPVEKIDTRAQYAFYEYTVRTSDKVELTLEGTIFWQVINVPKMIGKTSDPCWSILNKLRSDVGSPQIVVQVADYFVVLQLCLRLP